MLSQTRQPAQDWRSRAPFTSLYSSLFPSMNTDIYLAADFFPLLISWPVPSHSVILCFYMNPSVCHILPAAHNSPADQSIFPYHLPSPKMKMKWSLPQFMLCFSTTFKYNMEWRRNLESGGKINKGALRFSQSVPACCYFKILSLRCEFRCLWQICKLSKTTTPFQISLGEMVNILVFAWKCQVRW